MLMHEFLRPNCTMYMYLYIGTRTRHRAFPSGLCSLHSWI